MGEEQGLSAENRATLARLHLLILNWSGEPISPHAEIGRLTYQMLGQIMDAARAEGLQPPVVEVDEKVFSSLGASRARSSASAGVAETPSGGWQSMETAPRDGTSILIDDRHQGVVIGWWETGREFSGSPHFNDWCSGHNTAGGYDAGFERIHQPLGWVPLPSRQTSGGEA